MFDGALALNGKNGVGEVSDEEMFHAMYLSYVGIRVTDLEKSVDFYTKLFGLKEVARGDNSDIGGGVYVFIERSGIGTETGTQLVP